MVSFRCAGSTGRGLCISTAIVLAATALFTTSLHAWHHQPALYRPLSLTCIATSALCLGLGIARPTPLIFGLALVVLFGIPEAFAVTHRVTQPAHAPARSRSSLDHRVAGVVSDF